MVARHITIYYAQRTLSFQGTEPKRTFREDIRRRILILRACKSRCANADLKFSEEEARGKNKSRLSLKE